MRTWLVLASLWAVGGCGRLRFQELEAGQDAQPGIQDGDRDGSSVCIGDPCLAASCDPLPIGTACGDRLFCDGIGGCTMAVREVGCDSPITADMLCRGAGFAGATQATGYYWFQCQGYAERVCPGTGWDFDAMTCTTWCGYQDCTQIDYCGAGYTAYELSGDGSTSFDPLAYGLDCQSYNPGWLVLARCYH